MRIFIIAIAIFLIGCGSVEPTPLEQKAPSEMTEAERKAEIQRILDKIGVKLPENWEAMTRQERGEFLLPYLMQADLSE